MAVGPLFKPARRSGREARRHGEEVRQVPQWLQIMLAVYLVAGTLYFLRGTGAQK